MLSTLHCRKDYKTKGQHRASKFIPRFDGPYEIINVHLDTSTVTLDMPNAPNLFPTFHTPNLKPWLPNDDIKYPSHILLQPGPIDIDGYDKFIVESIIDHQKIGRGFRYLVHFLRLWLRQQPLDNWC